MTMTCPRRGEAFAFGAGVKDQDLWRADDTCSYCGGMNPTRALTLLEAGEEVLPTDKNYKAYIGQEHKKFYYPHFSEAQQIRFIELYNERKLKVGEPGYFYVLPFFMHFTINLPKPATSTP